MALEAPFPWFGGKSRVAKEVWARFGNVPNFVEPFFGSGAVLLGRPHEPGIETVNDRDDYIANFWRAIKADPERVAYYADQPVSEVDLTARHLWLVNNCQDLPQRLEGDPDYYDAKVAGWWVWGICCWIGREWCEGKGPWQIIDGKIEKVGGDVGVKRQQPHVGRSQGITRQQPHVGGGRGVIRKLPHLGGGRGVNRKLPPSSLSVWFEALSQRLRRVRVCCGDWERVCGLSPTEMLGLTGVFLDPPYGEEANRDMAIYRIESGTISRRVREWCQERGQSKLMRLALCGYEGEHNELEALGWTKVAWKAKGGYGNLSNGQAQLNAHRERIWFSPHCLKAEQGTLSW